MTEIVSGAELWRARPRRGMAGDGCLNPVASILLSKAGAEPKCDAPNWLSPDAHALDRQRLAKPVREGQAGMVPVRRSLC